MLVYEANFAKNGKPKIGSGTLEIVNVLPVVGIKFVGKASFCQCIKRAEQQEMADAPMVVWIPIYRDF